MKRIISVLMSLIMVCSMSLTAYASSETSYVCSQEQRVSFDDVLALEEFVIRNQDGTLSLDMKAALKKGSNPIAIDALNQHFTVINPQILKGEISTEEDLSITNGEHYIYSHRCNKGINSYTTYWWGYKRYACNCESVRIVNDLNTCVAGGAMTGGAATGIAIVFPVTAPVAGMIAAGAAFDAGYWGLLATRITANNNGRGTIINMTHVLVFDIEPQ